MYRFASFGPAEGAAPIRLVGSGAILPEVIHAAQILADDWNVRSEVWSATSFSELARDARAVERSNRLHPKGEQAASHVGACLAGTAPIIAASDYVRAYPQLIASYVQAPFIALGTDGFGRSDTRQALRAFFEVDRHGIAVAALAALVPGETITPEQVAEAIARYDIAADANTPWTV
jgi:pyruvate dehydrogenase E1 component